MAQREALITGGGWHLMPRDLQPGLAGFRELGLDPCRARAAQSRDAGNPQQRSPASSWGLPAGRGQRALPCLVGTSGLLPALCP